jgi:nucleoside phosphorylase
MESLIDIDTHHYTGATDAHYHISRSGLPQPRASGAVKRATLHAGLIVTDGSKYAIGFKDIPLHISRHNGYILKLRWISTRFLVMWDDEEKRGWLVNGTSALLHLVRASLKYDMHSEFEDVFLFRAEDLVEALERYHPSSAVKVLLDPANRKLKLYEKASGYLHLEDRVESIYNSLEQILDYQTGVIETSGVRPRNELEGWDFKDLASEQDQCHLRVAVLKNPGWADFARDIHAVSLFGRGFGDIIKPAPEAATPCGQWTVLPKNNYYLAACAADLLKLIDLHGDQKAQPRRVSENVMWHNPNKVIPGCACEGKALGNCFDPVQILLPVSFPTDMLPITSVPLNSRGAIIFGYDASLKPVWPVTEDLEGELGSSEDSGTQFHDSGIGQSIGPPGSVSRTKSPSTDSEPFTVHNYRAGIVCTLPKELLAVRALFDERHANVQIPPEDTNHYALGRMGEHNVVAACLPCGVYGTNSAADVVSHMIRTFPVKFCLLVGIGGGMPSSKNDIRLGDVVVSQTGVIQYDLGKALGNGTFEAIGRLHRPPRFLTTAMAILQGDPDGSPVILQKYIDQIGKRRPEYRYPGKEKDQLFSSDYLHHPTFEDCEKCDGPVHIRGSRTHTHPVIHYGLVASGNTVMKDARIRDRMAAERGFLCVEMEAAGVMETVPFLAIRGICDYADSHKNKIWQEYASATAAGYAKLFLSAVRNTPDPSSGSSTKLLPPHAKLRKSASQYRKSLPTYLSRCDKTQEY